MGQHTARGPYDVIEPLELDHVRAESKPQALAPRTESEGAAKPQQKGSGENIKPPRGCKRFVLCCMF
jgi:hypothetical protein